MVFKVNLNSGDDPLNGDASGISGSVKKLIDDLKKSSNAKQLTVGAVSGFATGYLAAKFGKIVATAIGGSLLLIQIAKYNGYIDIDWKKFNDDVKVAKAKIDKNKSKVPQLVENVSQFASENVVLAGGFASGLLLGFATA